MFCYDILTYDLQMSSNPFATPLNRANNNMTSKTALRVIEAYCGKDVGKGIARIDYDLMRSLDISVGDMRCLARKRLLLYACHSNHARKKKITEVL